MEEILFNTGSGNGLLPDGTKELTGHQHDGNKLLASHQHDSTKPSATTKVLWHSSHGIVYLTTQGINPKIVFEIDILKITATSSSTLWVK